MTSTDYAPKCAKCGGPAEVSEHVDARHTGTVTTVTRKCLSPECGEVDCFAVSGDQRTRKA